MSTKYFLNQDCIAENISATGRFMVPHISVVNSISGIVDEVNINLSDRITTVSATLEGTISSVSSDITGIIDDINYTDNGDIPAYVISSVNQDGGKIKVGRRKLTTEDISGLAIIPDDFNGKVNHRIKFEYSHDSKKIILGINGKPADTCLSIDCDDFIKDGMLSDVYTEEEQSGYPQLVFVWNTDAGHTTTKIDIRRILGHIYNAGEYLTFDIDRYEFDVDLPKLTDKLNINKMLKYVGHINNPTTISSNYLSGIFSGIIETDSVLNGTFVDVGFSDPTVSATTLDNELTVGKGDIIVVHSHVNQVEIDKKDLVFGQNVFVIKAGVSRYEFEALTPSLQLDDISLSGAETISVITGIGETNGVVHISAETLVPTMISGLREELDKLSCTVRVLTSDSQLSDIQNPKSGDIAIVSSQMGTSEELSSKYSITGYVRKDTDGVANISGWAAMDGNYSADNVYLTSNIELWGSYSKVGNFEKPGVSGIISCAGWSVSKMFDEMLNKTIQPEISPTVPTVSLTITGHPSSGSDSTSFEVGTKLSSGYTVAFNQGKYYQPWSGGTVNDGTQVSSWSVRDSNGNTWTTNTNSGTDIGYIQTTYIVYAKAGYEAGAIAKDNKGNDSNPPVQRQGGTTGEVSKTITCYRKTFYYVGTTYGMDEITSEFMRQSGNGHSSEIGDKSSKSLTIPEGTMMVCFAKIGHHNISKLKVLDTGGAMVIDATPNFSVKYLDIYGANNQYPTEYTVFYAICPSEAGYKATKYDFTIS